MDNFFHLIMVIWSFHASLNFAKVGINTVFLPAICFCFSSRKTTQPPVAHSGLKTSPLSFWHSQDSWTPHLVGSALREM